MLPSHKIPDTTSWDPLYVVSQVTRHATLKSSSSDAYAACNAICVIGVFRIVKANLESSIPRVKVLFQFRHRLESVPGQEHVRVSGHTPGRVVARACHRLEYDADVGWRRGIRRSLGSWHSGTVSACRIRSVSSSGSGSKGHPGTPGWKRCSTGSGRAA